MAPRSWGRVGAVAALGLITVVASALPAAPAGAAGRTLRYYNVNQTTIATDAAGRPLPSNGQGAAPVAGDHLDYTALDYAGDPRRHASTYTASSHLACTFQTPTMLTCNAQFAIGSSLLLGNDVTATLSPDATSSIPVNTGTGRYKNAKGTIVVTPVRNSLNADVTIRLSGLAAWPAPIGQMARSRSAQYGSRSFRL